MRRSGPPDTTRWLIDELSAGGIDGWTVLDVGAGVGAVHLALLESGASTAVDVDASSAYVAAAREEAARRGVSDRVRHEVGDFVAVAPSVETADVVALDRVVCCYGDMAALVSLSAARARRRYGLVYPKDAAWIRFGFGVANAISRIFRSRTRIYAHRTADVDGLIRAAGLAPKMRRTNVFWQIVVYERPMEAPATP